MVREPATARGDGVTGNVLCVYKNNVLLTRCLPTCRPRSPTPGGLGGLTGGTQSAPPLDGIKRDKSVSRRCLWAILSHWRETTFLTLNVRTTLVLTLVSVF